MLHVLHCISILVNHGELEIDCVDFEKLTPLHIAVRHGAAAAAKVLIELNADLLKKNGVSVKVSDLN